MKKIYLYFIFLMALVFTPVLSNAENDIAREDAPVACTLEAKLCPDGSFVGRQGPNCEFEVCPGETQEQEKERNQNEERERERINYDESGSDDAVQNRIQEEEREREREGYDDGFATSTDDMEDGVEDELDNGNDVEKRKSRVANAVQEMVRVASSTSASIGEQIRTIAQEQNRIHQDAEGVIKGVAERGGFLRFFVGPDYSEIKKAEKFAEQYNDRLEKIGETMEKVTSEEVVTAIEIQITELKAVKIELEEEIETQKRGFSLFGWLNRLFSR